MWITTSESFNANFEMLWNFLDYIRHEQQTNVNSLYCNNSTIKNESKHKINQEHINQEYQKEHRLYSLNSAKTEFNQIC